MNRINFNIKDRKILYMILGIVFMSVFTLTVAYAALNAVLDISGSAQVSSAEWDVHFDNVKVTNGSVSGDDPRITSPTTATFLTTLNMPGEFYEFTIDVVNDGSIDAMIENITKTPTLTSEQAKYLKYDITYQNGESITTKQLVEKKSFVRLKVRLEFRNDLSSSDLPTSSETLNLGLQLDYTQSDGSGSSINSNGVLEYIDYSFSPSDYDSKMGTTTATDSNVVIPETFEYDGKWYKVTSIEQSAFALNSKLESITIPDSVQSIKVGAFVMCSNLKSVKLSSNLQHIYDLAFAECQNLRNISFPDSLLSIGSTAFGNCKSFTSVKIPANVSTIGGGAFSGIDLISSIDVDTNNNNFCSIDGVLYDMNVTRLISAPSSKTEINIPNTVTKIDTNAIFNTLITSIIIPSSVTVIGDGALRANRSLENISYTGTVEQWNAIYFDNSSFKWNADTPATEVVCSDGTVSLV